METAQHFDVLIVGAGISGIDAAYRLQAERPGTSFAVLETKDTIGGTWATHRYPGIRSDSDLFTFGFDWKPWMGVPIATGGEILGYLQKAVDEQDLRRHIRFGHRVASADWDNRAQRWRAEVETPDGVRVVTAGFLWLCSGYYDHDRGYVPDWPGMSDYRGTLIHPQQWPDNLDHAGKRVAVIGSGATAATLVPALTQGGAQVTMIQRSPTYYLPRPQSEPFRAELATLGLRPEVYHEVMRAKNLADAGRIADRARTEPDALAADLIGAAREVLRDDAMIAEHFTPRYRVWRQRLCVLPEGDMLHALKGGGAEIVTDTIDRFTETGLRLGSGHEVDADIIVSATGLILTAFGDIALSVNGRAVDPARCITHRGIMFTGLPNMAVVFGYIRSSWTLRAGLVSRYVCRLLDHMLASGAGMVEPVAPEGMTLRPWITDDNFNAGYITRALDILPKQGDHQPWLMTQDYYVDRKDLPAARFDDGSLVFTAVPARAAAE